MANTHLKILHILTLMTFLVVCNSCDDEILKGQRAYSFSGLVSDSVTGLGIDSTAIIIDDTLSRLRFYSDSTGQYFGGSYGGSIKLFAKKSGYRLQSQDLVLDKNLANIDFRLVPDSI